MKFKGDIIITDPCYIMKKEKEIPIPNYLDYMSTETYHKSPALFTEEEKKQSENWKEAMEPYWEEKHKPDDWDKCDYGENMEALGIKTYLTSNTEYGDWSCHTFEEGTNKDLGQFCADAGLVSVFLLDEVLEYNPNFDYHLNRLHTTTLIKGFDGDIQITHRQFTDEDNYQDTEVSVIGKGNINFYTTQTGA